jgi:tRNA(Met) C34 N-acetyltransferase TmcA
LSRFLTLIVAPQLLGRAAEIAIRDGSEVIDPTIVARVSEKLRLLTV